VWWLYHRKGDIDGKLTKKTFPLISLQAALSVVAIFFLWYGIDLIDPTVGAFFSRFEVLVVLALGMWIFKDRFRKWEAIGAFILLAGLFVIRYNADIQVSKGMYVILFSSTIFGISELVAKRIVRDVSPNTFALIRNCHILVYIVIYAAFSGNLEFSQIGRYYYLLPIAGFLGPGLGRPMYLHALKHLEVSKVATVNQMQPIAVAIISVFTIGLLPGIKEWIGGMLVISGCIIMIQGRDKKKV
ncbi:MAG: EamA family transporter, partial [candidate division Zixibacteria bacterium]|nr:EamA family transporter [candidate division Zixibacteria bacterium]